MVKSSLNTIYCLSRAAEYKDEETAAHIGRMGEYARVVGRCLGMREEEQQMLLYATPMHEHTLIGAKILAAGNNGFLKLARTIALSHHEKWDGSGYPHGLQGEAIPLHGRIAAVADVFDALSSKRPYKEAFSLEESARAVAEGKGSHFDPDMVDAFLAVKEEIFSVRRL